MLGLCALCYCAGRWTRGAELAAQSAPTVVPPVAAASAEPKEIAASFVHGRPAGESPDVITPLNVRDPANLVMAPEGVVFEKTSAGAKPDATAPGFPPARVFPRRRMDSKPNLRS